MADDAAPTTNANQPPSSPPGAGGASRRDRLDKWKALFAVACLIGVSVNLAHVFGLSANIRSTVQAWLFLPFLLSALVIASTRLRTWANKR